MPCCRAVCGACPPPWHGDIPDDVNRHNAKVLLDCNEGDLLEIPKVFEDPANLVRVPYSHWAVYVGNGRVVHLVPQRGGPGEVKEELFRDVVGNSLAKINNYLDEEKVRFRRREIVKRAQSKKGRVRWYHFLLQNCEHFATWCRYGVALSQQVTNGLVGGAVFGVLAVGWIVLFNR